MQPSVSALPFADPVSLYVPIEQARKAGELHRGEYQSARPFPHIVLDNFLPEDLARRILSEFPSALSSMEKGMVQYEHGYVGGQHKKQFDPNFLATPFARAVFQFLNSASVLQYVEGVTGIEGLLCDPYFDGGGFHEISPGGRLGIHADFRINKRLSMQRRVNLLLYLNENWQSSWGGALELWERNMQRCVRSVEPVFNRCVIFNTDADSFHGHPDPLKAPTGVTRKSIATYYYTASRSLYDEVPDRPTDYRVRPGDGLSVRSEKYWSNMKKRTKHLLQRIGSKSE